MCCQNLGKDLSRVCSQEMNLWKGVYRPLFLVFELLILSLVPVWFLSSYTVYLNLVQARERKKREKIMKFRTKPINGQTLIFDFLWFSFDFGSTSPCIGSLFVCVTASMVPLSLGWRGVTPLLPIIPSLGVTPIQGGVKDGEGWPLSSSGAHSARNALPNLLLSLISEKKNENVEENYNFSSFLLSTDFYPILDSGGGGLSGFWNPWFRLLERLL